MYNEYRAEIFRSQLICMLLAAFFIMHFFFSHSLCRAIHSMRYLSIFLPSAFLYLFSLLRSHFDSNGECIWRLFFRECVFNKRFVHLIRCVVIIQLVHTLCANVYQMKFAYTAKYWIFNSSNIKFTAMGALHVLPLSPTQPTSKKFSQLKTPPLLKFRMNGCRFFSISQMFICHQLFIHKCTLTHTRKHGNKNIDVVWIISWALPCFLVYLIPQ